MGHVYVKVTFYNAVDYVGYILGKRGFEEVRKVDAKAMVDTGATFLALQEDKIEELGLPVIGEHPAETVEGVKKVKLAAHGIIKIEDRMAEALVIIRPKGTTPLIGVIALEQMGYRVDPATGKLVKGLPLMLQEKYYNSLSLKDQSLPCQRSSIISLFSAQPSPLSFLALSPVMLCWHLLGYRLSHLV
ncbi:MAG: retroviral-like aspartic protease family protein [Nitrososphaerales archaeon]